MKIIRTDSELECPLIDRALREAGHELMLLPDGVGEEQLAEKARSGKLAAEEFQGGSFSISNLGMFGIDQFDAIINPPQGAILAIGAGTRQPIEIDHALAFATIVEMSLSCDHRAIDGAVGADFMRTLKELLESPAALVG